MSDVLVDDTGIRWTSDRSIRFTEVQDDGLLAICDLQWPTADLAQANYESAYKMFLERKIASTVGMMAGQGKRTEQFGPFYFTTLWGPPTWWLPRVHVRKWSVMVGWLRRGYVLAVLNKTPRG